MNVLWANRGGGVRVNLESGNVEASLVRALGLGFRA